MDPQNRLTHRQESLHKAYAMCLHAPSQVKLIECGVFSEICVLCSPVLLFGS